MGGSEQGNTDSFVYTVSLCSRNKLR